MVSKKKRFQILRINKGKKRRTWDFIAREFPLKIILNDQEIATLLSSPDWLKELAVGFLFSEGILKRRDDVKSIRYFSNEGVIKIKTKNETVEKIQHSHPEWSEGSQIPVLNKVKELEILPLRFAQGQNDKSQVFQRSQRNIKNRRKISTSLLLNLMKEMEKNSKTFKDTGGIHVCALADKKSIFLLKEDISRHNAIDKILGECFLNRIKTEGKIILTSGRISSEVIKKISRSKISLVVSRSAPTNLAIEMAQNFGITLVGFARAKRLNIYTYPERIKI